jgi:hypothetical protein
VRGGLAVLILALAAHAALALVACEAAQSPTTPAPTFASAPAAPSAATSPAPRPTPGASRPALRIDPALLALLPTEIAGFPVERSTDVEEADAADPTIPAEVDRLSAAFVHNDDLSNWAVATVVQIRPGVLSDAFLRSWRQSFDEGACEPAGGVTGTASTTIAGHQVDIGRCVEGVNTYHVRLPDDRIVSITSVGPERYGEQLVAGLSV